MSTKTPNPESQPDDLTVKEAADYLGRAPDYVYRLLRRQSINLPNAKRDADGRTWRIPQSDLNVWQRANPPESWWERIRHTQFWKRTAGAIAGIVFMLYVVNQVTGFFSNLLGSTPVWQWVCNQAPLNTTILCQGTLPIRPAVAGETLILIATFHGELANRDEPQVMIKEGIENEVAKLRAENRLGDLNLRVAIHPQELTGGKETQPIAIDFAKPYSASMVIWGEVTGTRVRVNFLNIRQPDFHALVPISFEEKQSTIAANPQAYNNFINDDLPSMTNFLTLFAIGQSYFANEEYQVAAELIEQSVSVTTRGTHVDGMSYAFFILGWLYQFPLSKLPQAIHNYSRSIELKSDDIEAYNNRGMVYAEQDNTKLAFRDFDKVISIAPKDAHGYYNRGLTYLYQDNLSSAIADFNEAAVLDSNHIHTFVARGNALYDQGDFASAIADYTLAISIDPTYLRSYTNRGIAYVAIGKFDLAISDFDYVLELDSQDTHAYFHRANIRSAYGMKQAAINDYNTVIKLDPAYILAYYHRGNDLIILGFLEAAIADFSQTILLAPTFSQALYNRGVAYHEMGNLEQSLLDLNDVIELTPNDPDAYFARGEIHYSKGDLEGAIADFDQAIKIKPKYYGVYRSRGIAKKYSGNQTDALLDFKKFLDYAPINNSLRPQVEKWIAEIEAELANKK